MALESLSLQKVCCVARPTWPYSFIQFTLWQSAGFVVMRSLICARLTQLLSIGMLTSACWVNVRVKRNWTCCHIILVWMFFSQHVPSVILDIGPTSVCAIPHFFKEKH